MKLIGKEGDKHLKKNYCNSRQNLPGCNAGTHKEKEIDDLNDKIYQGFTEEMDLGSGKCPSDILPYLHLHHQVKYKKGM